MVDSCKDFISGLPDSLLHQMLSKLSMKEAGKTSLLSSRWRELFASIPDLDFDDSYSLDPEDKTSFINFVDRVFELRGEDHVNKFSLKCGEHIWGVQVSSWISHVLSLGVTDLALHLSPQIYDPLPSEIFVHEELVRLTIGPKGVRSCELGHVYLPKLKTLSLESFKFENDEMGFANLLSRCEVLEELELSNLMWGDWDSCSASSETIKRLILLMSESSNKNPKSVSFDTPNVVFFRYSDYIAHKYPVLNFDSLVEADMDIKMTYNQTGEFGYGLDSDEEILDVSGNVYVLLMGICNVETLYISDNTLKTLNFCSEAIPVFHELTHLTIDSRNPLVGWKALPELSPNLETLIFQGLAHSDTDRCGGSCLCRNGSFENHAALSQCSVRFLGISFGEAYDSDDDESEMKTKMKNVEYFLEEMPNLELLTICSNSQPDDHLAVVSSRLQKLETIASRKGIEIQVVDGDLEEMHL